MLRIRSLILLGLLGFMVAPANAVTYTLQYVRYDNPFAIDYRVAGIGGGGGTLTGTCTGCGVSTATDDGFGNISIVGVNWTANAFGQIYSNSWDASTVVGSGVTLTKSNNVCNQVAGAFCTGNLSGFGGNTWYTGFAQDGTTANAAFVTNVTVSGDWLIVSHQAKLSESLASPSNQSYSLYYSSVPVPAAVWLFGSALGLLGVMRRRLMAA